jgi:hypothetical protein
LKPSAARSALAVLENDSPDEATISPLLAVRRQRGLPPASSYSSPAALFPETPPLGSPNRLSEQRIGESA